MVKGLGFEGRLIVASKDASSDYGIDATIDLCKDGNPRRQELLGRQVHVQVKGTDSSALTARVKASTWHYWDELQIPTLLILADVHTQEMRWTLPWQRFPSSEAATVEVDFSTSTPFRYADENLLGILSELTEIELGSRILRRLPAVREWTDQCSEEHSGMSLHSPFGQLYNHIRAVLLMAGNRVLPSLESVWSERIEPTVASNAQVPTFTDIACRKILRELGADYTLGLRRLRRRLDKSEQKFGSRLYDVKSDMQRYAHNLDIARLRRRLEGDPRRLPCANESCWWQHPEGRVPDSRKFIPGSGAVGGGTVALCCAIEDDWGGSYQNLVDSNEIDDFLNEPPGPSWGELSVVFPRLDEPWFAVN